MSLMNREILIKKLENSDEDQSKMNNFQFDDELKEKIYGLILERMNASSNITTGESSTNKNGSDEAVSTEKNCYNKKKHSQISSIEESPESGQSADINAQLKKAINELRYLKIFIIEVATKNTTKGYQDQRIISNIQYFIKLFYRKLSTAKKK